ncbi:SH3 domain-containing C40 family peptidase [Sulfuricurvum sp.]|uniref:SH3 domain-containing C40 family peptidase n=1 Tax=Sulfuricurvum sp. TaxID=2025608 RepID=UPI0019C69F78|nr:SH3 domain-containing C40 family peptidase [Sulfuricurvum sp.]MBD3798323.1 SH3 domain-containing protein [Campylobacterota bacterium]MBD3805564.1 SH3 domain-containing protein [Sulfuricurvum sp.]
MKTTLWMSGILLILVGCGAHTPSVPPPPPKPSNAPVISANLNTIDNPNPFCCSLSQDLDIKLLEYGPKINDLEKFEQSILPYAEQNGNDRESLYEVQNSFEARYFSVWNYQKVPQSLQEITWPLRAFRGGYGSNLQPVPLVWFEQIEYNSNFESYGTINQKGIALKAMDIRAFPTDKPLYKNPSLPGEGYPFDLLQSSTLHYNEPIFISHMSKDGAWSYIFSNNVSGWVKSEGIAAIDDQMVRNFQQAKKVFLLEDNIPLYTPLNQYTVHSRIGMVLPLERIEGEHYIVKTIDSNTTTRELLIPQHSAHIGVSRFNKKDLALIGSHLLKNTYGWGGMYGERDCSSMIRDFMTPFGVWLPRNSSAQAKMGEIISFEGLSNNEKLALIKEKGIPFETIIYLKGHVVLYIGTYQDNVLTFHNIWGIRTIDKGGNKGRHIIGKAVISTLDLGAELETFDPAMRLLSRVESMNIFTRPPNALTRNLKANPPKKKTL